MYPFLKKYASKSYQQAFEQLTNDKDAILKQYVEDMSDPAQSHLVGIQKQVCKQSERAILRSLLQESLENDGEVYRKFLHLLSVRDENGTACFPDSDDEESRHDSEEEGADPEEMKREESKELALFSALKFSHLQMAIEISRGLIKYLSD